MVLGKFPHYTAKLISAKDESPKRHQFPKCQVCKETFKLGEFVLGETKTILRNGRPIEGGDTYPSYTQYWHAVNCFGFFRTTLVDDKKRVSTLIKKHGGRETQEFQDAYNDFLNRRFEDFNQMSKSNQNILRTIMEKGEYKMVDSDEEQQQETTRTTKKRKRNKDDEKGEQQQTKSSKTK